MAEQPDLERIRRQHYPDAFGGCLHCGETWPCEARTLLDALDAERERNSILMEMSKDWPDRHDTLARQREEARDLAVLLEGEVATLRAELEQARVQLAGCLVAAEGATADPAKQGDYGWSLAYQKVLELRLSRDAAMTDSNTALIENSQLTAERDALRGDVERLRARLEAIRDYEPSQFEVAFDEFAYNRLRDTYRDAARAALAQPGLATPPGHTAGPHAWQRRTTAEHTPADDDYPAPARNSSRHPESYCHRCGGPNHSWYAPSPLWNVVMRPEGEASEQWSIICPTCFMELGEAAGVAEYWRVDSREVKVKLPTTSPDGRVWDPRIELWVEPAALGSLPELATDAGKRGARGCTVRCPLYGDCPEPCGRVTGSGPTATEEPRGRAWVGERQVRPELALDSEYDPDRDGVPAAVAADMEMERREEKR